MRWILHTWSDVHCYGILQALIPSLTRGSTVLVMEQLMPVHGSVSIIRERGIRDRDVGQLGLYNGRGRDLEQWKRLFAEANGKGRFRFAGVSQPEGSVLAVLEVVWEG